MSGVGGGPAGWDAVRPALSGLGPITVSPPVAGSLIVVGHSYGGIGALRLAASAPARVAAVVLTGCFFPPARGGRSWRSSIVDYARHRAAYVRVVAARPRAPRPSRRAFRQMSQLARLGLHPHAFHAMADEVRCPVLVIHGEDDHLVPITFARVAWAAHPAWAFRELAHAGHRAHEQHPAVWAAIVLEWLTSRRKGTAR